MELIVQESCDLLDSTMKVEQLLTKFEVYFFSKHSYFRKILLVSPVKIFKQTSKELVSRRCSGPSQS